MYELNNGDICSLFTDYSNINCKDKVSLDLLYRTLHIYTFLNFHSY